MCIEESCGAKIALNIESNNSQLYGKEHTEQCGKNAKDFYRQELLKQRINVLSMDSETDGLKPLQLFKKCFAEFKNVTISKGFKTKMLSHIRYVRFHRKHKNTPMGKQLLRTQETEENLFKFFFTF